MDLVGCTNILSKIMGSPNKLNNALATVEALSTFKIGKFPERAKKKAEIATTSEESAVTASEATPSQETAPKKAVAKKPASSAEKKPAPKKAAPKKDA